MQGYKIEGNKGTWLQSEEYAGVNGAMTRKGRVLCDDNTLKAVYCGLPDTFFSIPGYIRVNGKRVKGFVSHENFTFRFIRNSY
jgi:hypothetical protein